MTGEKTAVYQTVEKVVRRAVAQGAVNEVIHTKVNNLAKPQDFIKHLTLNLIKKPSFTALIIHMIKQHEQVSVPEEFKFSDQSMAQIYQREQDTPSLPLAGMFLDLSNSSSEEDKKTEEREVSVAF